MKMALVSMRQLLDHAAENIYGVPAFTSTIWSRSRPSWRRQPNWNAPVIMQASAGARKYAGEKFLKHLIEAAVRELSRRSRWRCTRTHGQSPAVCGIGRSGWDFLGS